VQITPNNFVAEAARGDVPGPDRGNRKGAGAKANDRNARRHGRRSAEYRERYAPLRKMLADARALCARNRALAKQITAELNARDRSVSGDRCT
jgi:hypothetical protein